jgi:methylmalonyl-CoA/ethylmalonyl-CoA epimerase
LSTSVLPSPSLSRSIPLFETLLKTPCYKTEEVGQRKRNHRFFQNPGDTKIELLEATDGHGVLKKFIDKRGEGLHHIAFEVEDIAAKWPG